MNFNFVTHTPPGTVTGYLREFIKIGGYYFMAHHTDSVIFRSVDGLNWTNISGTLSASVTCLCVNADGTIILAGCADGAVYRSTDTGATWTRYDVSTYEISRIVFANGTFYRSEQLYNSGKYGAYRSSTDGINWTLLKNTTTERFYALAGIGTDVYLVGDNATQGCVFKSVGGGVPSQVYSSANTIGFYAVAELGAGRVGVCGFNGAFEYSDDGGSTWTKATGIPAVTLSSIGVFNGNVYVASTSNIYESTDNGATFTAYSVPDISGTIQNIRYIDGFVVLIGSGGVYITSRGNTVSGTVTDAAGNPAARTVRAYRRDTGQLVHETTSSAVDGSYSLLLGDVGEIDRVVIADDVAEGVVYNDIIDRVIASGGTV